MTRPSVIVPLVTPLTPERELDLDSLGSLIDYVVDRGVDGVLVLGSSGECVALSAEQRLEVARFTTAHGRGRTKVMLGVAAWGAADAIGEARALAALDPDWLLVCAPGGMRLSPDELAQHFERIAAVGAPVIAYDVPARVIVGLEPSMIASLAEHGVIAGLKDSTGDIVKARRYADATRHIPGFVRYTGCEEVVDGTLLVGYDGAVPGMAMVFPEWHVALAAAAEAGRWDEAARLQGEIVQLMDLYFHTLPGGSFLAQFFASVKEALRQKGVIAHATTSAEFVVAGDSLTQHVTRILELGEKLRPGLPA